MNFYEIHFSIGPIPAFLDGVRIGKVCYISTSSVVGVLYLVLNEFL